MIKLELVREILNEQLQDLKTVSLPYAVECDRNPEGIRDLIAKTESAIVYTQAITQEKLSQWLELNFREGERILDCMLRMKDEQPT